MVENEIGSWFRNYGEHYLWPQLLRGQKDAEFHTWTTEKAVYP